METRSSWLMGELFRDTYRYRELIWALAQKELRVRYKRSVLGFLWALLNPALMMLVLTLVFGTIMRFSIDHYAVFLLSMLLPWTFFSAGTDAWPVSFHAGRIIFLRHYQCFLS